jgi:hypothetical protein
LLRLTTNGVLQGGPLLFVFKVSVTSLPRLQP